MINTNYHVEPTVIGLRIRKLRLECNLTQLQLANKLEDLGFPISVRKISYYELGEFKTIDIDLLVKLSDFFNCELGYLLGVINCKNRMCDDIVSATGLSEEAINLILSWKNSDFAKERLCTLSKLISNKYFDHLIALLGAKVNTNNIPDEPGNNCPEYAISGADTVLLYNYSEETIIKSDLKDTITKIGDEIRIYESKDPNYNS